MRRLEAMIEAAAYQLENRPALLAALGTLGTIVGVILAMNVA